MSVFLPAAFLGILAGFYLEGHGLPAWPFLAAVPACLGVPRLRPAAITLAVIALSIPLREAARPAPEARPGYWVYAAAAVEGRLVAPPAARGNGRIRLLVAAERLELFRFGAQAVAGRIALYSDATNTVQDGEGRCLPVASLRAGERLRIVGELEPLPEDRPEIAAAFRRLGIEGLVYAPQSLERLPPALGVLAAFGERLRGCLGRLPPRVAAFLRAMLLGDKSGLAAADIAAFRRAGVAHLLAVSGLHVGALAACGVLVLGALGLGRRRAALVTAVLLPAYALLCGATPSVLRAAIAGTAALVLLAAGRRASAWHLLSLAGIVILVGDPETLATPAFLLSFSATAGILAWRVALERGLAALALPRLVRAPLAVSLAAQLAVLPVAAAFFGSVAPWGPLVNLLIVPLALGALAFGTLGALAGVTAAALPVEGVLELVGLLAALPGAQLALPAFTPAAALVYYALLCLLLLGTARPSYRRLAALLRESFAGC